MDFIEQSLQIPAAGVALDADVAVPQPAQGVVLFAHGSGSSRHSPRNTFVAEELQDAGMATVLVDLLTPAEERVDAITAELRFDIGLLAGRLTALIDWLVEHDITAGLGIGLFGASTGAAAALVRRRPALIAVAAVVSRGGRPDLAGPALRSVRQPTLLIVGERDAVVLDLNRRAMQGSAARFASRSFRAQPISSGTRRVGTGRPPGPRLVRPSPAARRSRSFASRILGCRARRLRAGELDDDAIGPVPGEMVPRPSGEHAGPAVHSREAFALWKGTAPTRCGPATKTVPPQPWRQPSGQPYFERRMPSGDLKSEAMRILADAARTKSSVASWPTRPPHDDVQGRYILFKIGDRRWLIRRLDPPQAPSPDPTPGTDAAVDRAPRRL